MNRYLMVGLSFMFAWATTTLACTKAQATQIVDASGAVCGEVALVVDPGLAPFCATAAEVADVIVALSTLPDGARRAGPPPSPRQIRDAILARRATKAVRS